MKDHQPPWTDGSWQIPPPKHESVMMPGQEKPKTGLLQVSNAKNMFMEVAHATVQVLESGGLVAQGVDGWKYIVSPSGYTFATFEPDERQ